MHAGGTNLFCVSVYPYLTVVIGLSRRQCGATREFTVPHSSIHLLSRLRLPILHINIKLFVSYADKPHSPCNRLASGETITSIDC